MAQSIGQLIGFCILLYVSYWVYKDAKSRGMNATGWCIFVFLILIIGLPFYLLSRKPKIEPVEDDEQTDEDIRQHENNT
jgi:hypothetical protein